MDMGGKCIATANQSVINKTLKGYIILLLTFMIEII